jgi:DNA-binding winged helix-turn-helix (wHTH) protein/tetratricopeptide (TPR) repeat protein
MSSEIINYYFEDFCFEVENERLMKGDLPVSLTAKAVEILHILIENHGRFVRKEEIIEHVWSDSFVEEANLTQQIYVLRKSLGQTANGQPFIETIPKKGYRFAAPVTKAAAAEFEVNDNFEELFLIKSEQSASAASSLEDEKTIGYIFGDFKLNMQRRMLYRGEQPLHLPAKVFDTLALLVENFGRLITKDELMDKIWQARFVEENNLTQKIFILRRVLGDNRNEHQYIVTVPGEGYVFVAPVSPYRSETCARSFIEKESSAAQIPFVTPNIAVAVLPFKVFAPQESPLNEEFLAIGLADALVSQLSRYKEIVVRPTSSVFKFYNQERELAAVSRDLQATHLVEGIVQFFDSNSKTSVQLYESKTGGIVWADDFLSDAGSDLLTVQNQISNRVSKALALKLNIEPLQPENFLPKNFEAFQEYIKGKFHWNSRTIEGLKKGIVHAQNSLSIEPTFAMAYVGLADCYNLLAGQHSYMPPKEAFPKSKAASHNALEISADLAEAYASLAFATFYYDWNRPLAHRYFERAIELKPNYPTSHHWFGEALACEGRFDEAIAQLKKAQEFDPLSLAISADLAHAFLLAGRIAESRLLLDQILEINPQFVRAFYLYGQIFEASGEFDKALEVLRRAASLAPDEPAIRAEMGYFAARAGDEKAARQIIEQLEEAGAKRYVSSFLVAMIYLALNETDKVFKHLEIAFRERDVWLAWINVLPKLNALRKDERFTSLAARLGKG